MVGEVIQRDARFAAAYLGAFLLCAIAVARILLRTGPSQTQLGASARTVLTFTIVSYVVWLTQFMILRYAIPIEALSGTIIVLAVRTVVVGESPSRVHLRGAVVLSALIAAGLWFQTIYPNWGQGSIRAAGRVGRCAAAPSWKSGRIGKRPGVFCRSVSRCA